VDKNGVFEYGEMALNYVLAISNLDSGNIKKIIKQMKVKY